MRIPPISINGRRSMARTEGELRALLRELIQTNIRQMMANPQGFPPLRETRVRYRREPHGREIWQNARELLKSGIGDCEDLAAYEVARLFLQGLHVQGWLKPVDLGYHVLVLINGNRVYDPSRELGMGGQS